MILVKIRDFAFPDEDVRHTGTGPLTPRPNRRLQRRLSAWSTSSASSAGSSDHDDGAGASNSSYGFTGWSLNWFGSRSSVGSSIDGPSQGDFARNFTDAISPEYEIDDPYDSLDDDDDDNDHDGRDGGGIHGGDGSDDHEDGERPLYPGLYRALYAFEPEGTAEMALEEDQIVRVIGRGGGVGWAIVARGGEQGHALVPEGYLELVSLDRGQAGEEEG
jgi:Variant SH3 domain